MNLYRSTLKKRRARIPLHTRTMPSGPDDGLTLRRHRAAFIHCLLLLLLGGLLLPLAGPALHAAETTSGPPFILAIDPEHAYNDQDILIALRRAGFAKGVQVLAEGCNLAPQMLADVTVLSSSMLTATIPAGWPEGGYSLSALNPDGQKGEAFSVLVIMRRGEASFGPWSPTSSLMTGRSGLAAVAIGNSLYAIGGDGSYPGSGSIERAAILPDGSPGMWRYVGYLHIPWGKPAIIAIGDSLYALNWDVERATLNPDGSLGQWQFLSEMTTRRTGLAAVIVGRYLYALGGYSDDNSWLTSVERAEINADGTLGPWQPVLPRYCRARMLWHSGRTSMRWVAMLVWSAPRFCPMAGSRPGR